MSRKCKCYLNIPSVLVNKMECKEMHYSNCSLELQRRYDRGDFVIDPRDKDKKVVLQNPDLRQLICEQGVDILYHLGFNTADHDLKRMFGDVKFVCMGGTETRMKHFAEFLSSQLNVDNIEDLSAYSNRFAMFKVGCVLSMSHGIGNASISVVLQEVIKLLSYAEAKDPIIFRIGTSGGIGIAPGSVVVSKFSLNGLLEKTYDLPVLGKLVKMPAIFDERLGMELTLLREDNDPFNVYYGGTMAADDFYQGQGRTDGPINFQSESQKFEFLNKLRDLNVYNIEMESTALSAYTYKIGIRAADVCVTMVDRLDTDQVVTPKETMEDWQIRPMTIVCRYIKAQLAQKDR